MIFLESFKLLPCRKLGFSFFKSYVYWDDPKQERSEFPQSSRSKKGVGCRQAAVYYLSPDDVHHMSII